MNRSATESYVVTPPSILVQFLIVAAWGRVRSARFVQPLKICMPRDVTFAGITSFFIPLQFMNAWSPKLLYDLGMLMFPSFLHSANE